MRPIKVVGKFLDQPLLVAKFKQKVPLALTAAGSAYTFYAVKKADVEDKRTTARRLGLTMLGTIASALIAPVLVNKVFKNTTLSVNQIKEKNFSIVDNFLKNESVNNESERILTKAKDKILSLKEVDYLHTNYKDKKIFKDLIPEPENVTSKDIFSEISRLSLLGLIPVVGGILGGIAGDRLTMESWKENIPNKIKEGAYQYLANIFLCNIGAGIALALLEKANIRSKTSRAFGMVGGILTTGVLGGSAIANMIGNKVINPAFGDKENKSLYSERKPEALDIGLHTDDIATVAVMSGLKWIEPALPIMYSISGYRAGIGYRNVDKKR